MFSCFHILKYEDADLPIKFSMNITAISYQYKTEKIRLSCGDSEDRTHDLLLAKQALSQLSYIPNVPKSIYNWWAYVELHHRPHPYQGCALTN